MQEIIKFYLQREINQCIASIFARLQHSHPGLLQHRRVTLGSHCRRWHFGKVWWPVSKICMSSFNNIPQTLRRAMQSSVTPIRALMTHVGLPFIILTAPDTRTNNVFSPFSFESSFSITCLLLSSSQLYVSLFCSSRFGFQLIIGPLVGLSLTLFLPTPTCFLLLVPGSKNAWGTTELKRFLVVLVQRKRKRIDMHRLHSEHGAF